MRTVVCAAIFDGAGRLLLTRRAPGQRQSGYWELPGGKVENGETLDGALRRELFEELRLSADIGPEIARSTYHYDHVSIELVALAIRSFRGEMQLRVHDAAKWVAADNWRDLEIAPADIPLLAEIFRRQPLSYPESGATAVRSASR